MRTEPQILMCPPDYFGIEYEINAWMSRGRQANPSVARKQWLDLKSILISSGARVLLVDPVEDLPDMVFTANAGLVSANDVFLSQFRPAERRPEMPHFGRWFAQHQFDIHQLPEGMFFEGAGDALFCGSTLWAGYRIRSDAQSQQKLGQMLGCRVIPLELVDPFFYHLDTCFCPLAPEVAMYYPGAFDEYGRKALVELVPQLIEIDTVEAKSFAANAVVIGNRVVTNIGCANLHHRLRENGFDPIETPLSEFVKAGGSAKCLTLRLDGEDAATCLSPENPMSRESF